MADQDLMITVEDWMGHGTSVKKSECAEWKKQDNQKREHAAELLHEMAQKGIANASPELKKRLEERKRKRLSEQSKETK